MAVNNAASARYIGSIPSQESLRSTQVWYDQHRNTSFRDARGNAIFENGRPYYSIIEIQSGMPVGPVMPLDWSAPIYAPQKYLLKSIGRITNLPISDGHEGLRRDAKTDRFRIDYAAMRQEDEQASIDHWRLAVAHADKLGWEPPRYGAPMDRRLLELVGSAPRSPRIAEAFMAENPWALGMLMPVFNPATGRSEVEEDEQLARLLTLNRVDLLTPEQQDREMEKREAEERSRREVAQPDVVEEARKMLAEVNARLAELKALTPATSAPKKSHKKKVAVEVAP